MTRVIESPLQMREARAGLQGQVGFVPTMGALHQGHEELLKRARKENENLVLSIYVNKTQFNNSEDFEKYPSTWERDLQIAQDNGVDFVFRPTYEQMYPDNYRYRIIENDFSKILCGRDRPGHFDGVLSVVMKLFQITNPHRAYFGEKDFQQLKLIQGMVESFFLNIEVSPVPTVREADGLAMSSRNTRLSPAERERAPLIYQSISKSSSAEEASQLLEKNGFRVDYVRDLENRRFVAAYLGKVRLIDNVKI